jgi:segregation and condensation protein A
MPDTPHTEHLATQTPSPPSAGRSTPGVSGSRSQDDPSPFSLSVGQIYDGPLDVLLALIRKQDIDIYDIPIAKITAQFLVYVAQLQANEVDMAAEFVYVAAQLIHIKSKVLLPRPAGDQPEGQPEDPRRDLVNRLLEHERFKQAAQMLQEKQQLEEATWSNPGMRGFFDDDEPEEESLPESTSEGSFDLVAVFRQVAERAASRPTLDVDADSVTVSQMVDYLHRRLLIEDHPVMFIAILGDTPSHRLVIAAFLALLEMVRVGAVLLRQERIDGDIRIKKTADFEQVMSQSIATDFGAFGE